MNIHNILNCGADSPVLSVIRNITSSAAAGCGARRYRILAASAIVVATTFTVAAQAAVVDRTSVWTGNGANALWSNIYNWYLNNAPVNGSTVDIGSPATIATPALDDYSLTVADLTVQSGTAMAIAPGVGLIISGAGYVNDNGQITVNSSATGSNTGMAINGMVVLKGNGNILLNAVPGGSLFTANIYDGGSSNLTQNAGHTISGTGQITVDSFTNNGTVDANSSGNPLLLQYSVAGTFANNGTFEATNGGILNFGSGLFTNSGTILADAGTVEINGYTNLTNTGTMRADHGGLLATNNATINNTGGVIDAAGGNVTITSGKITGGIFSSTVGSEIDQQGITTLTNVGISPGSNLDIIDGSHIYFSAGSTAITTTNNGTITVNRGGSSTNTSIGISGAVELAGTGTVVLNGYAGNYQSAWINDIGNSNLTQDSGHTISGAGTVNVDSFTNNGTVNANTSGNSLLLETNGAPYTNNGLYEASNGGTLDVTYLSNVSSGTLTGGTYEVSANSTMLLPGTITTNAATIILIGSNTSFAAINTLTANTGTLSLRNGASFTTVGNFSNSGTVSLDPSTLNINGNLVLNSSSILNIGLTGTQAGSYDTIHVTGSATLGGMLSLNLASGFTASIGDSFNFISAGGGVTGLFSKNGPIDVNGYVFDLTNTSNGMGLQVAAVPEPPSLALMAVLGAGLLLRRKRNSRQRDDR